MQRTYSLTSKVIAALTAMGLAGLGCTSGDPEAAGDPSDRQVTLDVWTNVPDESGERELMEMGTTDTTLGELMSSGRTLMVDGFETQDLSAVRAGDEIVVPLNTGDTATLTRKADRLELTSFTGEDDGTDELPRGAVGAVRLLPDGVDVFLSGSQGSDADTIMRVSGLEDLEAERSALVTSLALDALLVSLEDGEQIPPAVAIAIIGGLVGSFWLGICGWTAWDCAHQCENNAGFEVHCAGITVSVNPPGVHTSGGFDCRCL